MTSLPRTKSIAHRRGRNHSNPVYDLQDPEFKNILIGKNGKIGPKIILPDSYVLLDEIEDLQVHESLSFQDWLGYIEMNWDEINVYHVNWFYEHVQIRFHCENSRGERVKILFQVVLKDGGEDLVFEYSNKDFKDDFGASCSGFSDYGFTLPWPHRELRVGTYEDMCAFMNEPSGNGTVTGGVLARGLDGNCRFLIKVLKEVVLPTKNSDGSLPKIHGVVLYCLKMQKKVNLMMMIAHHIAFAIDTKQSDYAPYGGLISHIMRKWDIRRPGPQLLPAPVALGATLIGNQGLTRVLGRLVAKWEVPFLVGEEKEEYDRIMGTKKKRKSTSRPSTSGAGTSGQQQQAFPQDAPQVPDQQGGEGSSQYRQFLEEQFEALRQRQMEFEVNQIDFNERQHQFQLQQEEFEQRRQASDQRNARGIQGIRRFLRCFGRRSGATEEEMRHLDSD